MGNLARAGAAALLFFCVSGCGKPEPPQITVQSSKVIGADVNGLEIEVHVDVFNPNRVNLGVRSFTGKSVVGGKYELGTATIDKPVSLPGNAHTPIDVPFTMRWQNLQTLAALASQTGNIPYELTGTAAIGGESFSIDVPFRASGTLTHDQIVGTALRSIPGMPGIPLPR